MYVCVYKHICIYHVHKYVHNHSACSSRICKWRPHPSTAPTKTTLVVLFLTRALLWFSCLLQGSFAKETYNFKEPINRSHPIALSLICRVNLRVVPPKMKSEGSCPIRYIYVSIYHIVLSIHTFVYICVCICEPTDVFACVYKYTNIRTNPHMYIYLYIHICRYI